MHCTLNVAHVIAMWRDLLCHVNLHWPQTIFALSLDRQHVNLSVMNNEHAHGSRIIG